MAQAVISGLLTFAVVFIVLMVIERFIHRWRHNPDRSYRWGVWLFALLAALFVFLSGLGRSL